MGRQDAGGNWQQSTSKLHPADRRLRQQSVAELEIIKKKEQTDEDSPMENLDIRMKNSHNQREMSQHLAHRALTKCGMLIKHPNRKVNTNPTRAVIRAGTQGQYQKAACCGTIALCTQRLRAVRGMTSDMWRQSGTVGGLKVGTDGRVIGAHADARLLELDKA